ncbi:hypothetical protein ELS82_10880 [Vibrio ouci]|uniref:Oxidoreductase n=2 Tax=Vibrio ouci TaxID=2499078 RepID=A0A4Y8WFL3_9VIBR|nr:hypothetical protein ELS82_10880 [Vibrio ouci]
MTSFLRAFLMSCAVVLVSTAHAIPSPQGEPILWISGKISQSNSASGVEMDEAMVQGLDKGTIRTNNHVIEQVTEYSGPTLISLLDYVGATGTQVKVTAWDEYVATIPIADIKTYQVLLATHESGKRMTIDDKGPFFIVFPFSDHPELKNDYYYSLSVWQIKDIVVE